MTNLDDFEKFKEEFDEHWRKFTEGLTPDQIQEKLCPPKPEMDWEQCDLCDAKGQTSCGTCHCGKAGHVRAILFYTGTYCTECYKKAMESAYQDFDPEEDEDEIMQPVLKIKKLTETAKLPTKAHVTDLGYDLYADEDAYIKSGQTVKISTGIAVGFPENWGGFIKDRSSMASKGLQVKGGVIDQAYIGELSIVISWMIEVADSGGIINNHTASFHVKKGDKIAQLVPIPLTNFPVVEVDDLEATDRGEKGFGSSGTT